MAYTIDQVVNSGTDYEYSLSVPIRQLMNNGIWTPENVSEYVFAGLTDTRVQYIADIPDPDTAVTSQSTNHSYNDEYNMTTFESWSRNTPNLVLAQRGSELSDFQFYQRNVLVSPATPGSTALGLDTLRLVLDIKDIKKFMMDFDSNAVHSQVTLTSFNGTTGNGYTGSAYHWGSSVTVGPTVTSKDPAPAGTTIQLHVASICIINGEMWFGYLNPSTNHNEFYTNQGFSRRLFNIYGHSSQTNQYRSGKRGMQTSSTSKYSLYPGWSGGSGAVIFPAYADIGSSSTDKNFYYEGHDKTIIECAFKYNDPYDGVAATSCSMSSGHLVKDFDGLCNWLSWCGLYFKINNTIYKPIITGGIITGYTNDMSTVSDFDTLKNVTGNNVPVTPPVTPETDKVDDMTVNPLFALSSDAGFAAYFLMTQSQITSLHTWLTTTTFPDGYDPYPYIISLLQYPLKLTPTWCLAGTAGNIHIGGEDTGISASVIGTEQTWRGLGTFEVPRLNNNFMDYDPYSQYECYIPCCGWVTLPDIVAGHEISVRINYDLTTASIIGNVYVKINGSSLLIASKSGMMGRETVVSGDAQGVRSAQITSALLSAGTGALNVATGIMSGNAVAAVSGGYNIVSGLAQANIASNSSYARQIGSTGGRALLCQYDKCYLKITTTDADIPAGYGHTIGYICNKYGKVSSFSGFTVFENFDTTGISGLTERERAEVKRIMESGVYINSPPA